MKDNDGVLLRDYKNFTFLHLLAKGDSLGELEAVALDPLAFGLEMTIYFLIDLLKSHKVELVVKGEI
jgi:hypothetical protein